MMPTKAHWRIEVEWEDSTILQRGWYEIDDALEKRAEVVKCHSIGFVLADDKQGIVLAASVHGSEAAGITVIPRRAIVSRRRL